MTDGIINVYKESGYTSFDVVAKLRGIFRQKKIGHTGTLDPMATGVLPVCLGKATKLAGFLTESDKCYRAVMKLGFETDTEDITGEKTRESSDEERAAADERHVREAIDSFVGVFDQIPPMYSAIKKDGKKLCEYARAGIEIQRQPRRIEIYEIFDTEKLSDDVYSFYVRCSKGTYIRSLCRDIGRKLSCYAVLAELERVEAHGFSVSDAMKLSAIEQAVGDGTIGEHILSVDALLGEFPAYTVKDAGVSYLKNGNRLSPSFFRNMGLSRPPRIRVYADGTFLALYDYAETERIYKPFKMFL